MPSRSTTTAIAYLLNFITISLDNKLTALALFIDVSKAFDSLDHNTLISKLQHYGVRGTTLKWFESYLHVTSRYHFTTINNQRSSFKTITSGIPQGSILGPLLYTIYVNDIFFVADTVKCMLYADDTALVVTGKTREDVLHNASIFLLHFLFGLLLVILHSIH